MAAAAAVAIVLLLLAAAAAASAGGAAPLSLAMRSLTDTFGREAAARPQSMSSMATPSRSARRFNSSDGSSGNSRGAADSKPFGGHTSGFLSTSCCQSCILGALCQVKPSGLSKQFWTPVFFVSPTT